MRYRNVSRGAIDLADGRIVGVGGFVELGDKPRKTKVPKSASPRDAELAAAADAVILAASNEHPHNVAHISDGVLIEAPAKPDAEQPEDEPELPDTDPTTADDAASQESSK